MNIIKYATNPEYRYLVRKIKGVESLIYNLNFLIFQARAAREELRQQMDSKKFRLDKLNEEIKKQEPEKEKNIDEFKRLEDEKVLLERDIDRLINGKPGDEDVVCIKGLDNRIEGVLPCKDYPVGQKGLKQDRKDWQELLALYRKYMEMT